MLENGLRVVNIFDPNTTQVGLLEFSRFPKNHHLPRHEAAVAVAVTVGSFSDPEAAVGKSKQSR